MNKIVYENTFFCATCFKILLFWTKFVSEIYIVVHLTAKILLIWTKLYMKHTFLCRQSVKIRGKYTLCSIVTHYLHKILFFWTKLYMKHTFLCRQSVKTRGKYTLCSILTHHLHIFVQQRVKNQEESPLLCSFVTHQLKFLCFRTTKGVRKPEISVGGSRNYTKVGFPITTLNFRSTSNYRSHLQNGGNIWYFWIGKYI